MAVVHQSKDLTRAATQPPWRRAISVAVAAAMVLAVPVRSFAPARAQEDAGDKGGPPIVRVVIINDPQFNAFVMDGRHIFINTGALLQADTPNEVIGVLAHETGHMAGGHLAKMRQQLAQ